MDLAGLASSRQTEVLRVLDGHADHPEEMRRERLHAGRGGRADGAGLDRGQGAVPRLRDGREAQAGVHGGSRTNGTNLISN